MSVRTLTPFARRLHALALRSERPLQGLWRGVYDRATRAYAAYLTRGVPGAAVYVRGSHGSGDPVYALSDIDLAVVVPDGARAPVRRRWRRARRAIGDLLFDWPLVIQRGELDEVAGSTAFTYGLDDDDDDDDGGGGGERALYAGPAADDDLVRLAERPELFAGTAGWRLVRGPERRPAERPRAPGERSAAAWLLLQNWWRLLFQVCLDASGPRTAHLCLKLYAEPARIWLWLARGECVELREDALRRGLEALPDEEAALRSALALLRELPESPPPPLDAVVPYLVRMSSRIAALLGGEAARAGDTPVALSWKGPEELALPFGGWEPGESPLGEGAAPGLLPLVDWRALVVPFAPDQAFAPVDGDPREVAVLAAAAQAAPRGGAYPALRAEDLLVLPTVVWTRSSLRAVQCAAIDPVSFALADGRDVARFPEVPGLSAHDRARRAVSEHRAWLTRGRWDRHSGYELGRLLTAARAGLFLESVETGEPELPLTVAATLRALAARGAARPAAAAERAYAAFTAEWREVPSAVARDLRRAVEELPAYADAGSATRSRS